MQHSDFIGRRERIRTSDPFVPNEMRYQAALHAEATAILDIQTTVSTTTGAMLYCILNFAE